MKCWMFILRLGCGAAAACERPRDLWPNWSATSKEYLKCIRLHSGHILNISELWIFMIRFEELSMDFHTLHVIAPVKSLPGLRGSMPSCAEQAPNPSNTSTTGTGTSRREIGWGWFVALVADMNQNQVAAIWEIYDVNLSTLPSEEPRF